VDLARTVLCYAAKEAARGTAFRWSRPETRLNGSSRGRRHGAIVGSLNQQRINGRSTIVDRSAFRPRRDSDGGLCDQRVSYLPDATRHVIWNFDPSLRTEIVEVP
jgi:hypothetical protein